MLNIVSMGCSSSVVCMEGHLGTGMLKFSTKKNKRAA
jgi:hypothetical protein